MSTTIYNRRRGAKANRPRLRDTIRTHRPSASPCTSMPVWAQRRCTRYCDEHQSQKGRAV